MTATDPTLLGRWPAQLVERIASKNFMLVVGAGISRQCTNDDGKSPPSWKELMNELAKTFTTGTLRKAVSELVAQQRYLEAAELLRVRARIQSKEDDFLSELPL